MKNKLNNFIFLFILLVAVMACSLSVDLGENIEKVFEPQVSEEVLPSEEQEPTQVAQPPKESEKPEEGAFLCPLDLVPAAMPEIEMCYPPDYVSGVSLSFYDANPPTEDEVWMFMVHPQMVHISLTDYVLKRAAFIRVYPVAEYRAMDPYVEEIITGLQYLHVSRDPSPDRIRFVPYQNAAQIMAANVAYLDFRNGWGVRFITQDAQDTLPINNEEAYYAFLGLTADGKYLVSAVLPISSPIFFPHADSYLDMDWALVADRYGDYISELKEEMATQPPESFMPSLTLLDAMISTLLVPPGLLD